MVALSKIATELEGYESSRAAIVELRRRLRSASGNWVKVAAVGGEPESGFEQSFASLAYAYFKDKAPRLLDYLVGFQLVERNDDNTKAIGIFGFNLGNTWLYAPVFFLNGDLKGHELLYLKDKDLFVPLAENWVNDILAHKPHVLGESSPQQTREMGGLMPDIQTFSTPPRNNKFGSDKDAEDDAPGWLRPAMPLMAAAAFQREDKLFDKHADLRDKFDLSKVLGENFQLLKLAHHWYERCPAIKSGIDRFYGPNLFYKAALKIKEMSESSCKSVMPKPPKPPEAPKPPKVRKSASLIPEKVEEVLRHPTDKGTLKIAVADEETIDEQKKEYTEEERERLLRDGMLVEDHRTGEEVSVAYNVQKPSELFNPHDSGLYDVLERTGSFSRMLFISNPHSGQGKKNFGVLVRVGDGDKAWMNVHRSNVFARDLESDEDFRSWFDGLSDSGLQKDGVYVIVSPGGAGTVPFKVVKSLGDGLYKVRWKDYCYEGRAGWLPELQEDRDPYRVNMIGGVECDLIRTDHRARDFRNLNGEMFIPEEAKVVRIEKPPEDDDYSLVDTCCDSSDPKPIQPGSLLDVQLKLQEKAARLKLIHDNGEFMIQTKHRGLERGVKKASYICLVRDHGFRPDTAKEMLKTAEIKGAAKYFVKYAPVYLQKRAFNGGFLTQNAPTAPQITDPDYGFDDSFGNVPTQNMHEDFLPVDSLDSGLTDPSIYDPMDLPDQGVQQIAESAAQSGQKEVFDTDMLGGMLKTLRHDAIVDRYLGDLMKALDKLGRILFMFYWHQEEFEDRYGKQDMPELEDSLRNSFETLGDLVLFLKEKTIESVPNQADIAPNIESIART